MNGDDNTLKNSYWPEADQAHRVVQEFMKKVPPEVLPPGDPDSPEARILEAARKIFAEKGFDATSTREIAEAAKVNQAMIHYYFRSKAGLYKRVLITQMFLLFREIGRRVDPNSAGDEFVVTMPVLMVNVFRKHPVWLKLVRRELAGGAVGLLEVMRELGPIGPKGFRDMLQSRYEEGLQSGKLRDIDFNSLSHLLITLAYGIMLIDPLLEQVSGTTARDDETWVVRSKAFVSILSDGIKTKGKGEA